MKLHILSDLHLEFDRDRPWQPVRDLDFDVLILAGDICVHTHGLDWAVRHYPDKPVIYVIGNHEYYGAELHGLRREILAKVESARAQGREIYVLDNAAIEIGGVRFLGSTLWTDYQLFGNGSEMGFAMNEAKRCMNDHTLIRCAPLPHFTPAQALDLHNQARRWVTRELNTAFDGKTVVVTHHLPSRQSVAPRFENQPLSAAFASNLDRLVEKADLWIHGHTHDSFDYQLGKCRVVCNPRGYPGENPAFRADWVVGV
jgi:predicted phosphodiesterase